MSVNRSAWTCAKRLPPRFFQTFSPGRFETCCPERQLAGYAHAPFSFVSNLGQEVLGGRQSSCPPAMLLDAVQVLPLGSAGHGLAKSDGAGDGAIPSGM